MRARSTSGRAPGLNPGASQRNLQNSQHTINIFLKMPDYSTFSWYEEWDVDKSFHLPEFEEVPECQVSVISSRPQ